MSMPPSLGQPDSLSCLEFTHIESWRNGYRKVCNLDKLRKENLHLWFWLAQSPCALGVCRLAVKSTVSCLPGSWYLDSGVWRMVVPVAVAFTITCPNSVSWAYVPQYSWHLLTNSRRSTGVHQTALYFSQHTWRTSLLSVSEKQIDEFGLLIYSSKASGILPLGLIGRSDVFWCSQSKFANFVCENWIRCDYHLDGITEVLLRLFHEEQSTLTQNGFHHFKWTGNNDVPKAFSTYWQVLYLF